MKKARHIDNVQWKRPVTKEYTLYDSSYTNVKNRANYLIVLEIRRVGPLGEEF